MKKTLIYSLFILLFPFVAFSAEMGAWNEEQKFTSSSHNWGGTQTFNTTSSTSGYNGTLNTPTLTSDSSASGGSVYVTGGNDSGGTNFAVHDGAGTADFVIKGDGKVGIGTASPSKELHVSGEILATGPLRLAGVGNNVYTSNGSTIIDMDWDANQSDRAIRFTNNNQADTYMVIIEGGNVGIGNASPSTKLQVDGVTGVSAYRFGNQGQTISADTTLTPDDLGKVFFVDTSCVIKIPDPASATTFYQYKTEFCLEGAEGGVSLFTNAGSIGHTGNSGATIWINDTDAWLTLRYSISGNSIFYADDNGSWQTVSP